MFELRSAEVLERTGRRTDGRGRGSAGTVDGRPEPSSGDISERPAEREAAGDAEAGRPTAEADRLAAMADR